MALKKTIAGYRRDFEVDMLKADGTFSHKEKRSEWVDQVDLDMHPLEEDCTLKEWAIPHIHAKAVPKPTKEQEHDWLIEHGIEHVKQKRKEHLDSLAAIQPELDAAHGAWRGAEKGWNDHSELCFANGHCPDTFQGDARQLLKMPEGK